MYCFSFGKFIYGALYFFSFWRRSRMRKRKKNNYMLVTKSKNTNRIVAICGAHFMPIVMFPITKLSLIMVLSCHFFRSELKKKRRELERKRMDVLACTWTNRINAMWPNWRTRPDFFLFSSLKPRPVKKVLFQLREITFNNLQSTFNRYFILLPIKRNINR